MIKSGIMLHEPQASFFGKDISYVCLFELLEVLEYHRWLICDQYGPSYFQQNQTQIQVH